MAGKFDRFRVNINHHIEKIGIALSGGLDSAAVLHELCQINFPESITAFCLRQEDVSKEGMFSNRLASTYGVNLIFWDFNEEEYYLALKECMCFFDRPRWNIWPYILLKKAKQKSIEHFYVGEGADEIFGYRDRSYLKGWISQLEYIWPVWKQSGDHLGIQIHAPFLELEASINGMGLPTTLPYFCGSLKQDLWNEYKDKLKGPVIYPKVPCVSYYDILGKSKKQLLVEATRFWIEQWGFVDGQCQRLDKLLEA